MSLKQNKSETLSKLQDVFHALKEEHLEPQWFDEFDKAIAKLLEEELELFQIILVGEFYNGLHEGQARSEPPIEQFDADSLLEKYKTLLTNGSVAYGVISQLETEILNRLKK